MALAPSIKKVVLPSSPPASATYSFIDIAEGTGIVSYYLFQAVASGSTVYGMTTDTSLRGGLIAYKSIAGNKDIDFDVQFNKPKNIKGKLRFSTSIGAHRTAGTSDISMQPSVYHYDGTTETELASGAFIKLSNDGTDGNDKAECRTIEFDITSTQHFKIGDILRLNIKYQATYGTEGAVGFGTDPAGRDDRIEGGFQKVLYDQASTTALPTTSILQVPFKLDI